MGLDYKNLDERTRALMIVEIQQDIDSGTLFLSDNLNQQGRVDYQSLLVAATRVGNDDSLAAELKSRLNSHEKPRRLQSGGFSKPPVMRSNAHEMLAEGEFNRFYIRALCQRAIQDLIGELVIYRAKAVQSARSESEAKIGQTIAPDALLNDLLTHKGIDTALGLPPGPNSGLSVRLP